jgi:hypothetical protein
VASDVVVAAVLPVVAGWLCANAGAAIAADKASSAQSILLMANANALCFIFPFSLVSKTTPVVQEKPYELLCPFHDDDAPRFTECAQH